ncbi:hypothetical protein AX17_003447 [Amanita inopinata Kibby_2008]|nr:hypothetical protein AX17_003447 [Amanita inopinata Kibby_2008]
MKSACSNNAQDNLEETFSTGQPGNIQAALARTLSRSITLYFSRPVRLFRPSKVSGWHSLKGLAAQHGKSLTPQYVCSLVKDQGLMVLPRHFIPPMLVNALLGTVLWSTYTTTHDLVEPFAGQQSTMTAALSGAAAGGVQALVAAPAENVRIILEGTSGSRSWAHAWQEVFRGNSKPSPASDPKAIHEIRELRSWWKEVGEMAGRGWEGWGWGCAKDMCGFAVFFSIFEVTRRLAVQARDTSHRLTASLPSDEDDFADVKSRQRHVSRTVHSIILVVGGVTAGLAYERVCRPWDVARHSIQADMAASSAARGSYSVVGALFRKVRKDGILEFVRDPEAPRGISKRHYRNRIYKTLRTLGRVGPWGVGFLVWETFEPGLA